MTEQKPLSFFIELAYGVTSYYLGQPINGRVVLTMNEPKKCKGVTLMLHGDSIVNFDVNAEGKPGSITNKQWGSDFHSILTMSATSFGFKEKDQTLTLKRYEWPFTFETNSLNLPASFEGKHGNITYYLKAVFKRGILSRDYVAILPVTFVPSVDANNPTYNAWREAKFKKAITTWFGFSSRGDLKFEMLLERNGFIPGDEMKVKIKLENSVSEKSKETVKKATLFLIQNVRYSIGSKDKFVEKQLLELPIITVDRKLERNAVYDQQTNVKLPLTVPSFSHPSIAVWYQLKLKIEYEEETTPTILEVAFTVCTFRSASFIGNQSHALPITSQQNTPLYSENDNPPAYEEVTEGQQLVATNFQPSYDIILSNKLYPELPPAVENTTNITIQQASTSSSTSIIEPVIEKTIEPIPLSTEYVPLPPPPIPLLITTTTKTEEEKQEEEQNILEEEEEKQDDVEVIEKKMNKNKKKKQAIAI
jgi:hypothetical protein